MDKFSKLKVLRRLCLFTKEFDGEKLNSSSFLVRKSIIVLIFVMIVPLKIYISIFFDKNDKIQFIFGNEFNYLDSAPRMFAGYLGKC